MLVRAACLTHFTTVASASGLNPAALLESAGLDRNVESDPDRMIPVERVGHLLHRSAIESGNEAFALCMAESRRLSNLGLVGLAMRDQATLRDSLLVLMRHQASLNGSLSLRLEEYDDIVVLREQVRAGRPRQPVRQRIELAIGVMVRVLRQFLGASWQPRRVCFEHPPPATLKVHRQVLGPHIHFDQQFNGIVLSATDLAVHNVGADPAMARYALQLLRPSAQTPPGGLASDMRGTIALLLGSGRCGMVEVCSHLGLPVRTAQRALAGEGQSYSALLDEVRRELAARHVQDGRRPLTEVASLLGFSSPSSFSRWYQAAFGRSARESRGSKSGEAGVR